MKSANASMLQVLLSVLLLLGCMGGNFVRSSFVSHEPEVFSPHEIPALISDLPPRVRFSIATLAFFQGKLYAASSLGLLEFEDSKLVRLSRWSEKSPPIGGPWVEGDDRFLWIQKLDSDFLFRTDGMNWKAINLPKPERGYYSRGDILEGFTASAVGGEFWLVGAGDAWRLDRQEGVWRKSVPPRCKAGVVGIASLDGKMLFVCRNDFMHLRRSSRESDTIHYMDQDWKEIPSHLMTDPPASRAKEFFVEQIVGTGAKVYARTEWGEVLEVKLEEINKIETPGYCEALTVTSGGKLLASFRDKGIFLFDGKWTLRFSYPFDSGGTEHWAWLAENNGRVAFATESIPRIQPGGGFKDEGIDSLWVSEGGKLVPLFREGKWQPGVLGD